MVSRIYEFFKKLSLLFIFVSVDANNICIVIKIFVVKGFVKLSDDFDINILLTSLNNQIYEFRIPNIYN